MENSSIPNSTPAIGRISTPLLAQFGKSNNQSSRSSSIVQHWAFDVKRWMFSVVWRVKGAWWPSRSSKPPSAGNGRDRFDSYPQIQPRSLTIRVAQTPKIALTSLSSCAGCAAKLSQTILRQVLRGLPQTNGRNVLVGSSTGDDAGVYQLDRHRALVQTVDFFTPIVDDPFSYGAIAATNALSDVFAMGGRPLSALNIVGIPQETLSPKVVAAILRGGLSKATEVGCAVIGGHTIRAPEPIYGMAVTGIVDPAKMMTNANARAGDLLVLTKPLGTGIATTGIKRGLASRKLERKVIALMSTINSVGAELAERRLVW